MSTTAEPQSSIAVVAVASDDTWVHVYASVDELLEDRDIGTGHEEKSGALVFYDGRGRRLAPEFTPQWTLKDLVPLDGSERPDELYERLERAAEHLRQFIENNPRDVAQLGMEPAKAIDLIRWPDRSNLAGSLADLAQETEDGHAEGAGGVLRHRRSSLHNLKHRAGWKR
jgi:hypothetical protein